MGLRSKEFSGVGAGEAEKIEKAEGRQKIFRAQMGYWIEFIVSTLSLKIKKLLSMLEIFKKFVSDFLLSTHRPLGPFSPLGPYLSS